MKNYCQNVRGHGIQFYTFSLLIFSTKVLACSAHFANKLWNLFVFL